MGKGVKWIKMASTTLDTDRVYEPDSLIRIADVASQPINCRTSELKPPATHEPFI